MDQFYIGIVRKFDERNRSSDKQLNPSSAVLDFKSTVNFFIAISGS